MKYDLFLNNKWLWYEINVDVRFLFDFIGEIMFTLTVFSLFYQINKILTLYAVTSLNKSEKLGFLCRKQSINIVICGKSSHKDFQTLIIINNYL